MASELDQVIFEVTKKQVHFRRWLGMFSAIHSLTLILSHSLYVYPSLLSNRLGIQIAKKRLGKQPIAIKFGQWYEAL